MASEKYTYSISEDFPTGKVCPSRLENEIHTSSIVIALDYIETDGDNCNIWFKAPLGTTDETTLGTIVASHSGEPLPVEPVSPTGVPYIELLAREGSSVNKVSHNWCDKCTWYTQSVRVIEEELTDSGDHTTFGSEHTHWIDLNHGRLYAEDRIKADYLPVISINGTPATERPPFRETGGDFVIDYETGDVTFTESQEGNTVTATYNYSNGSRFLVAPLEGKRLVVEKSKVQASTDLAMTDSIHFQPWAYNPADMPNKVPVAEATIYKTWRDFVEEAEAAFPVVPALGGGDPARSVAEHISFPYHYLTGKSLYYSMGLEIRVWLENDTPFTGTFGTVTFRCSVFSETDE